MRTTLLLLVVVGVLYAISTPAVALDETWKPITDVTGRHVKDLGTWAVVKHSEVFNDGLRSNKVVSGEVQIVAGGMKYRLNIQGVQIGDMDAMYKAEVFEQDSPYITIRKLISFGRAN